MVNLPFSGVPIAGNAPPTPDWYRIFQSVLGPITPDAQTILANAEVGTWTPVATFATVGDLSVAYATQAGYYTDFGVGVWLQASLSFTPTWTTASGTFRITGLPVTPSRVRTFFPAGNMDGDWTWPTSVTQVAAVAESNGVVRVYGQGSGIATAIFTTSHLTSGNAHQIDFAGFYEQ